MFCVRLCPQWYVLLQWVYSCIENSEMQVLILLIFVC